MRLIVAYTQMLERHLSERIDERGREFMDFARSEATRMTRLL